MPNANALGQVEQSLLLLFGRPSLRASPSPTVQLVDVDQLVVHDSSNKTFLRVDVEEPLH